MHEDYEIFSTMKSLNHTYTFNYIETQSVVVNEGVYMVMILEADSMYDQTFEIFRNVWRMGYQCQVAGYLLMMSLQGIQHHDSTFGKYLPFQFYNQGKYFTPTCI